MTRRAVGTALLKRHLFQTYRVLVSLQAERTRRDAGRAYTVVIDLERGLAEAIGDGPDPDRGRPCVRVRFERQERLTFEGMAGRVLEALEREAGRVPARGLAEPIRSLLVLYGAYRRADQLEP